MHCSPQNTPQGLCVPSTASPQPGEDTSWLSPWVTILSPGKHQQDPPAQILQGRMVTGKVSCSQRKAVLLWQQGDQELIFELCSKFQLPTCFAWPGCAPPAPSSPRAWDGCGEKLGEGLCSTWWALARGDLYGHHLPAWGGI